MKKIFLIPFIFVLASCSKDEPTYTPLQLYDIAMKCDKSIEQLRLNDLNRPVCAKYPEGCVQEFVFRYKIRLVEMAVLMYRTPELAQKAAKELNQFYVRNWLFDEVKGEPVLEDYVTKCFGAKLSE